jgi:ABC-type amino acid transport substrate-binding protein
VRLFDPIAYAVRLLCIVTPCACAALIPALRAGRIDSIAASGTIDPFGVSLGARSPDQLGKDLGGTSVLQIEHF